MRSGFRNFRGAGPLIYVNMIVVSLSDGEYIRCPHQSGYILQGYCVYFVYRMLRKYVENVIIVCSVCTRNTRA